jgi:glycosyltransferase involved in cell wall biosynthesis
MAKAFANILGRDFIFLVSGSVGNDLAETNAISLKAPVRGRTLFYFFILPFLVFLKGFAGENNVFLSNDPNLLCVLIFWKKILFFKYKIFSDWHQLFEDWRDDFIARNSDFLSSTSEILKKSIVETSKIDSKKVIVARGGVDIENYSEPRQKKLLPDNKFIVGYVGYFRTMGKEKGIGTMIESLKFLPEEILMIFVGARGNEAEKYEAIAGKNSVGKRCVFIKYVPESKVAEYEKTVDLLVIPYPDEPHFRNFGFPMKVYEYMASGRPIVYSALPIMAEVLGDCAYSFTPGSAESLAEKIYYVFKNGSEAEKMTEKAVLKVSEFTWKKRAERMIKFVLESDE